MKKLTNLLLYSTIAGTALAASPELSVLEFRSGKLVPWPTEYSLKQKGTMAKSKVKISLAERQVKKIKEWTVIVENKSSKTAKLCLRLSVPCGNAGGAFWDGFQIKAKTSKTFSPTTARYIFPAVTYVKDGLMTGIGYAPMTVSSRFERSCEILNGRAVLVFDSYMALDPGQKDKVFFISQSAKANDYTEFVEQVYLAYPEWFHVVQGADPRIFGMGGYFFSSEDNREYQMEEARRFGFNWEWYYNCYQKAGNHYPLEKFWDKSKGYKSEVGSLFGKCDRPGSIKDWIDYNKARITAGNKDAAMFFYYLQQYCNTDMVKKYYPETVWIDKNGKATGPTFGWAEEDGAQYAWFLHSKLGDDIRKQLRMIWDEFPIAGFALDCAIGDTRYYGKLLKNETGKAFDDQGKVFATEGIGLAYNMDYTHKLPAKPDGRRAASIINEFYTWLPMMYADAAIHEMTPFDRVDLLAPRRLIAGQKPYYFWKGFRCDSLLKWESLTKEEAREGITGIVDHTILASLRYGIIPAVFYFKGFHDIKNLNPTLKKLVKAGWHAATYVEIEGKKPVADPFAQEEDIWISRYGSGDESYIVLSAPDLKGAKGKARILTARFGAPGAVYADISGKVTRNQVKADETLVDFNLKNRDPLILKKIGVAKPAGNSVIEASLSVKVPGKAQIAKFAFMENPSEVQVAEAGWEKKSASPKEVVFAKAPRFTFVLDNKFIQDIVLAEKKKVKAVIAVSPEDLAKNPDAVKLLEIYYDYYSTRQARPEYRLAQLTKFWNKKMRLPVVSPDSPLIKQAATVFAVGEKAQKILMPGTDRQNAVAAVSKDKQLIVGFFPGKSISTLELVKELLAGMDEKYPYIGGIKERWAIKLKLYGKTFKK